MFAAVTHFGDRRTDFTAVFADKFVSASQLCSGQYASACKAAGISS